MNNIISEYRISGDTIQDNVCLSNILGYDYNWRNIRRENIFYNLNHFFDKNGDGYHSRSVSMLEYTSSEVVDKLKKSFEVEPILVDEINPNQYIISTNGLHRFHVLKIHYLTELANAALSDNVKIDEINAKYTIPVQVCKVNYFRTYCNFMLNAIFENVWVSEERDSNFNKTGKMKIEYQDNKLILTDDEVITLINDNLYKNSYFCSTIVENYYKKYGTFKEFIDENFPSLIPMIERHI